MIKKNKFSILELLRLKPSPRSVDYVVNKTQFQLHALLTEQRHPLTWNLSRVIKQNSEGGLRQLLEVDHDVTQKLSSLAENDQILAILEGAAKTIVEALERGNKIFIYGCGSTGRLAKFIESTLWRPFWRRVKRKPLWKKLRSFLPADIEERLVGEMTGGDRALISALEGFEDLPLIGQLQVQDRNIQKGDVVFCVTEGGETSSVIGAMLAAAEMWPRRKSSLAKAKKHLYFIYNNPDHVLLPLERSREVLTHPAITKICLATGPQAITGSTRLQATTAETYLLGLILERAVFLLLSRYLQLEELADLGFKAEVEIKKELKNFFLLPSLLLSQIKQIASFTKLETSVYQRHKRTTYFAKRALLTVFIDGAERSPTFHLEPLDPVTKKERGCWFQVWTEAADHTEAWRRLLGRKFRGLKLSFYQPVLAEKVADPYLREVALKSLLKADNTQQNLYDFSFSGRNMRHRSPQHGDLAVMVGVGDEIQELKEKASSWRRFFRRARKKGAHLALVFTGNYSKPEFYRALKSLDQISARDAITYLPFPPLADPLQLRQQLVLKMLLNAHSTAVMAILGRVVGNTMTSVNPSNLKLIGRATYLIMSHVNDALKSDKAALNFQTTKPLTYAEANALLFDALENFPSRPADISEVDLAIIRALEAFRRQGSVPWDEAAKIAQSLGLEAYLGRCHWAQPLCLDNLGS